MFLADVFLFRRCLRGAHFYLVEFIIVNTSMYFVSIQKEHCLADEANNLFDMGSFSSEFMYLRIINYNIK